MRAFTPSIAPAIFAIRPDFRALSIRASGVRNSTGNSLAAAALEQACRALCPGSWAEAHLEAWRDAYRAFGAKPQRTPCSAEALRKRAIRDGSLPSINAVVDLYNAVSLRFAVPVGGENVEAYAGLPLLTRSLGNEPFATTRDGAPAIETCEAGEVIWRDDLGATCRRWNWRQCARTRIETETTEMWFILESLGPMPDAALMAAGRELLMGLASIAAGSHMEVKIHTKDGVSLLPIEGLS